jgi:hypothetical protein
MDSATPRPTTTRLTSSPLTFGSTFRTKREPPAWVTRLRYRGTRHVSLQARIAPLLASIVDVNGCYTSPHR